METTANAPAIPKLHKLRVALPTVAILILAGIVVATVTDRWNAWTGDRSRQTTDDAYLRSDVPPLSTKSAGIVAQVATTDYQKVKAGDLLVSSPTTISAPRSASPRRAWPAPRRRSTRFASRRCCSR